MKHLRQRGLGFISLLFVGGLLAFTGVVVAQLVPTYIEFLAVKKAVQKASTGATVFDVRSIFDKAAQIDDIKSITGQDLVVGKAGDRVVVSFAYQREIPIGGPAYILMKYEGHSQ